MSDLEKKVATIARLVLAEDPAEVEKAKSKLLTLMNSSAAVEEAAHKKNVEEHVRDVLLEIGAPDHLIGHAYTVDAIMTVIEDPALLNKVVHALYPAIAEKHDTTVSRLERAIRHVVEVAFDRGDMDVLGKYFGNTISRSKGKPTNAEFIARIANIVKMRMKNAA